MYTDLFLKHLKPLCVLLLCSIITESFGAPRVQIRKNNIESLPELWNIQVISDFKVPKIVNVKITAYNRSNILLYEASSENFVLQPGISNFNLNGQFSVQVKYTNDQMIHLLDNKELTVAISMFDASSYTELSQIRQTIQFNTRHAQEAPDTSRTGKIKKNIDLGGTIELTGLYNTREDTLFYMPFDYFRLQTRHQVQISDLPFTYDMYVTTEQKYTNQRLNSYSFRFDYETFKQQLLTKITQKVETIEQITAMRAGAPYRIRFRLTEAAVGSFDHGAISIVTEESLATRFPIPYFDTIPVPDAEGWIEVTFYAPAESFWMAIGAEKLGATESTTAYIDDISLKEGWIVDKKCPLPGSIYAKKGKYRFGFNGQERETELNPSITSAEYWMYDARRAGRWNVDPKADFFPGISSYSVFLNNPVKFKDPNGDVVEIKSTTDEGLTVQYRRGKLYGADNKRYTGSDESINQVYQGILHTRAHDKNNTFDKLAESKNILTIQLTSETGGNHVEYSLSGQKVEQTRDVTPENITGISATVFWNPNQGLRVSVESLFNTGRQSPSMSLLHEAAHVERTFGIAAIINDNQRRDHVYQWWGDHENKVYGDTYNIWTNAEERRVITQIETPTINSINRMNFGVMSKQMGTRNWHNPGVSSSDFLFFRTNDVKSVTPVFRPIPYKQ